MEKLKCTVAVLWILTLAVPIASMADVANLKELKLTCFAQTRFDLVYGEYEKEGKTETGIISDQFKVSRVRIRANGKLVESLSFFVQLDAGSSPALKDVRLRVPCPFIPNLTYEAGRFLLPFGIQTPMNPYYLTTVDYCQVISTLNKGLWDVGVKAYGKYSLSDAVGLSYVGAIVNGNTGGFADNNKSKDILGRVGIALKDIGLKSVGVGGSVYIGKKPVEGQEDDVTKNRFGGDLKIEQDPILVKGEFLLGKDDEINSMGFYGIAAFKVLSKPKLQLAAKFDYLDVDTDVDDNESMIIASGFNCYFAAENVLQVFYKLTDKTDPKAEAEHGVIVQLGMIF